MQYFSGRFKDKASDLMLDFHSSIMFDQRLYKYDIVGSMAHAMGISNAGIISDKECTEIKNALSEILNDIENGEIEFSITYEDIHMNIEHILTQRIGELGKKLHTARSRNDQVALDIKLYARDKIVDIKNLLLQMMKTINTIADGTLDYYMPSFTHLQKAQPITFAHYVSAYSQMFKRDYLRLENAYDLLNYCPLGAAALAGSTYKIDRYYTSSLLEFDSPTENTIDSVSDRDHIIEIISALSIVMMHLSRFSEEIILFSSTDFGYIELSDEFSTGSSIMPQKKNPDAAELVRGKSGRVFGSLMSILTTMKGTPLAYNKDMQEDKEAFFDSIETVEASLTVFIGMLETMQIKKDTLLKSCGNGFINSTDLADYLVAKGIPFRDAYKIVGSIVYYAIEENVTLEDIDIETYKSYSNLFDKDIYKAISIETCVKNRSLFGGPSKESVEGSIKNLNHFIKTENTKTYKSDVNSILNKLLKS